MASESAKVGYLLWYQAACRKAPAPCAIRSCANRVVSEHSPNSAGVVLRIAISDHCLCVSHPRCLRTSWKLTSNCQRITNQERIFLGSVSRSVHREDRYTASLGLELSAWVTDQHPAHGHGEQARGVPNGRCRSDLNYALPAPVPVSDLGRLPNGSRILGYLRKVGQALALYACSPSLARAPWQSLSRRGQHPSASGL